MTRFRPLLIACLIFAAAALPRLLIVAQPITTQLDKTVPDDAYYYFLSARNVAAGRGPSVDGLNASNGWHPLWMLVNVPIFAPTYADQDTPVRIALALGAISDSLVAVCIYWALRRLQSESAAIVGGLAYAINVMPMFQSVNGLETGLAALMLALAWLQTLHLLRAPRGRTALVWGAIFGLAFLARTDSALVLAGLGIFAAWRLRRTPQLIVVGAITALIVVTPWFLWNYANFGSALDQVSSGAVPWTARARLAVDQPDQTTFAEGLRVLTYPAYWLRGDYLGAPPLVGFVLWIFGAWGIFRAFRSMDAAARQLGRLVLVLLVGGALLVFIHTFIRWYPRPWYFMITAQSLALALGLFWESLSRLSLRVAALTVGLAGMLLTGTFMWQIGLYPWQSAHQYAAALWAKENLPAGTRLASMNSGIIGYYSGLDTTNMDGVVNPQAFAAIQDHRMLRYMQSIGIDYFIELGQRRRERVRPVHGRRLPRTAPGNPNPHARISRLGRPAPLPSSNQQLRHEPYHVVCLARIL